MNDQPNILVNIVKPVQRIHRFLVREKQFDLPVPIKEYGNMSEADILIDELSYCIEQLHALAVNVPMLPSGEVDFKNLPKGPQDYKHYG